MKSTLARKTPMPIGAQRFHISDGVYAYRALGNELFPVATTQDAPTVPFDSVVAERGVIELLGRRFVLEEEGAYRFYRTFEEHYQCIVNRGDAFALCSALAWSSAHGNVHNDLDASSMLATLRRQKLLVTCGIVSRLAVMLAEYVGLEARWCNMFCRPEHVPLYGTGHTLVEVRDKRTGCWILFDIDGNSCFRNRAGQYMSFLDFFESCAESSYTKMPLSPHQPAAFGSFFKDDRTDSFDFWSDVFYLDDTNRDFYRTVAWAPTAGIGDVHVMDARLEGHLLPGPEEKVEFVEYESLWSRLYPGHPSTV